MTGVQAFLDRPWGLVQVTGPDATSFLQALVSQDLEPVPVGHSVASLLLHPQGKLDATFRATRTADGWWCDGEPAAAARLVASLGRFRIRVQVDLLDRTPDTARVAVLGDAVVTVSAGLVAVPVDRPGWRGTDVVGDATEVVAWLAAADLPVGTAAEAEARRIAAGIPRQGIDVDDTTIPQEAFLERDAVSFTKGCFLGQELVCRIDSRGHVNRFLRRLDLDGAIVPAAGDEVRVDGKAVGAVTSAAAVPGEARVVALAMVRREVEPPAAVEVVTAAGALAARVVPGDSTNAPD